MFLGYGTFILYHPGRVLIGPDSEFPKKSKAEKRSETQKKAEEKSQTVPELALSDDRTEMLADTERRFDSSGSGAGDHQFESTGITPIAWDERQ